MTTGIVTVGRKQYVSGLYWENSPSGRVAQAAKEAARQPGNQSDFFATRAGNKAGRVPQYGLAAADANLRPGLPSLAGCLANQQPGSWIGAFRLREGTALVVVRDDLIVPDGDLFFTDEVEARDRLYQEMAIGGFQRVYAPEPWGIPGADTMPLGLLLNERTDVRLRAVALSGQAKAMIAIGLGVLLMGLAAGWYIQEQNAKEEAERLRNLEVLKRKEEESRLLSLTIQKPPEYPPPERKWEGEPKALEVVSACQAALAKIPVGVAGWRVTDLKCDGRTMSARWSRTGGFSNPPPLSVVSPGGTTAVSTIPIDPALQPRGDEALVDPDEVTRRYLNQNWTGTLARMTDDPPPPPPPNYSGQWNPPPPPWVKRSFTFVVPVLPWTLPVFIGDIPGVVVTSLTLNGSGAGSNESWAVEGVIYENRR